MTNTPMTFEEWWESDGQYVRSGGGDYEKSFAYEAWQQNQAVIAELVEALEEAILGLSNGLWDYGPGQDEHEQCDILLEKLRAISDKVKGK